MMGRWWPVAAGLLASSLAPAAAAETPAGTAIVNVAHVTYDADGGGTRDVASNPVTLIVAERLDVGLVRTGDAVPAIVAVPVAVPVVLTNMGSGDEAFALHTDSSTPSAAVQGIAIDRDGDGRFDPAVDTMLSGATPTLSPGETLKLVAVIAPMAAKVANGTMTLTAQAGTGSGATGTGFDGAGDEDGDAVVGSTGAAATVAVPFTGAGAATPTLVKAQAVRAPDGSAAPVSGAIVTYTLTGRFADTPTRDVRIDDPLPAGTVYLPGTLTLDGQALTDADDGDAGRVADSRVTVVLGDVASAAVHVVRFQIRLP